MASAVSSMDAFSIAISSFESEKFLRCPYSGAYLTDAVILPCYHIIAAKAAEEYFGKLVERRVAFAKPCKICSKHVISYQKCLQYSNLVEYVLQIKDLHETFTRLNAATSLLAPTISEGKESDKLNLMTTSTRSSIRRTSTPDISDDPDVIKDSARRQEILKEHKAKAENSRSKASKDEDDEIFKMD